MTTNPRSDGIEVDDSAWVDGGTPKTSYISPWYVMTLKHVDISYRVGSLAESLVTQAITNHSFRIGPE